MTDDNITAEESRTKNQPKKDFFGDGSPADIRESFTRISRPKTSVRAFKILEKTTICVGHPWPEGADVHDPKGFLRVVKTVFLENGVLVPYRKQVVLTKNGENDDWHFTHKNKGLRSSEPGNRRKWRKWRVSLRQNHRLPKTLFSPPWISKNFGQKSFGLNFRSLRKGAWSAWPATPTSATLPLPRGWQMPTVKDMMDLRNIRPATGIQISEPQNSLEPLPQESFWGDC